MSRLRIEGELTIATAAEHHARLRALLSPDRGCDVDLSAVTELDTAGLQVLLAVRREADRIGATLLLHAPSTAVSDVFTLVHLEDLAGGTP